MHAQDGLINIHDLLPESRVNGPGCRGVIWMQGCPFSCQGCFNQAARSLTGGKWLTPAAILKAFDFSRIEGITISGGEPFLQAAGLESLCDAIRQQGLSLMIFSGYTIAQLRQAENPHFRQVLEKIDILVDGPYQAELPPCTSWAGSGNQQVHYLSPGYSESAENTLPAVRFKEFHIDKTGEVCVTGF